MSRNVPWSKHISIDNPSHLYIFLHISASTCICHVVESSDSISFNCSSRARSLRFILKCNRSRGREEQGAGSAGPGEWPSIKSMRAINLWAVHWNVPECKQAIAGQIFLISVAKKEVRTFDQEQKQRQKHEEQDLCSSKHMQAVKRKGHNAR